MTTAMQSILARASQPKSAPDRILLVGTEGIGKSTFAADAPSPLFIAAEDGISQLTPKPMAIEPQSLDEVLGILRELAEGGHQYETVVIDTIDWMEPLIIAHICQENNWRDLDEPGYGKGYTPLEDKWREVLHALDRCRHQGKLEVILLAHSKQVLFSNPAGPDYNRYELGMNKRSANLVKQWADSVLFATYEEKVVTQKARGEDILKKGKAISTGRRIMHTMRVAAWDAKTRHNMPPVIELSYAEYAAHRGQHGASPEQRAELAALLEAIGDADLTAKVTEYVGDMSDATTVAKAINRLQCKLQQKEDNQ